MSLYNNTSTWVEWDVVVDLREREKPNDSELLCLIGVPVDQAHFVLARSPALPHHPSLLSLPTALHLYAFALCPSLVSFI